MKDIQFTVIVLCILYLCSLSSCRTTGHFTSNPKSKGAFAGTEFILSKDNRFQLRSWTDVYSIRKDASGNRIWNKRNYLGEGIYKRKKDSLELTFTSSDSLTLLIHYEQHLDSSKYEITIFNELGEVTTPPFTILDKNDNVLKDIFFHPPENPLMLTFKKSEIPTFIHFGTTAFLPIEQPKVYIEDINPGLHEFRLKTYRGYFPKGTKKTIWFKRTPTGIRYEMNGRKGYLPRKWNFSLLNSLYRDY